MEIISKVAVFCAIICGCLCIISGLPVIDLTGGSLAIPAEETIGNSEPIPQSELALSELVAEQNTTENGTIKDLYVIRAVVYEIGILTDVPENETNTATNETELM